MTQKFAPTFYILAVLAAIHFAIFGSGMTLVIACLSYLFGYLDEYFNPIETFNVYKIRTLDDNIYFLAAKDKQQAYKAVNTTFGEFVSSCRLMVPGVIDVFKAEVVTEV